MIPGSQIAHYRITSKLGEGGMGAVYRGTDTKLNREVAIKVLPSAFAEDAARMQRFEREAQVLASLNHPNIAAIYGIEAGAIVMELVEGDDLRGPVPVDTAIAYARQIAAGLEAAHEKGIVHRDLKPANIKVTPDGTVKLLDFGLAKATEQSAAASTAASPTMSPTLSLAMTQAGMILGTAAYMAPEQARGKVVDRRADIWAFGVVLFELLTGKMLFGGGDTVTDIIAAVVTREPDWPLLPADTPAHIRRLLERCLRKDPRLRLRDIGEARILLDEPELAAPSAAAPPPVRRSAVPWIAALAVAVAAAAAGWWQATRPALPLPLLRMNVDLGEDTPLAFIRGGATFDISPDGTRLAVVVDHGNRKRVLGIRALDQDITTVLAGTEGAENPFFSPDGAWIGFAADGKLKKVAVTGGAPLALCLFPQLRGASWAETDWIVAATGNGPAGLLRVPAAGGSPVPLTKLVKDERTHRWPQFLPEHQVVLYTAAGVSTNYEEADIVAESLKSGVRSTLVKGGHGARYLPSGHLLYQQNGTIYAARFDPGRMALAAPPVPILEEVRSAGAGGAQFACSRNGVFVYSAGTFHFGVSTVVWLDAAGHEKVVHGEPAEYSQPSLSPDNRRLAVCVRRAEGVMNSIWVKDLERGSFSRLTFNEGNNVTPVWTPDGKAIVYQVTGASTRGIYWIPSDGSGQARLLLDSPLAPRSFSPDGKILALAPLISQTGMFTAALEGSSGEPRLGKPQIFTSATGLGPMFSPDGKWIAYSSAESGHEVYVRPFPGPGGRWQVSTGGGAYAHWSQRTNELFYESPEAIMTVGYSVSGGAFVPGTPRVWAPIPPSTNRRGSPWDLAADGKQIILLKGAELSRQADRPETELTFLLNFFDELKRRIKP